MRFRVMVTANEMLKRPDLYPGTKPLPSVQAITRYMSRCALKLTEHIQQSFAKLHPECHLRFEQEQGGMEFRDADVSLYPEPGPPLAVSLSSIRRSQPRSPLRTQQQKPQGKASSPTISVSAGVISRGDALKRSLAGPFRSQRRSRRYIHEPTPRGAVDSCERCEITHAWGNLVGRHRAGASPSLPTTDGVKTVGVLCQVGRE
jgi:hypothetical protein